MKINDQWQFDQDKRWMAFDWEVIEPIYRYCLHNYQDNIVFHLERLVDNKDDIGHKTKLVNTVCSSLFLLSFIISF